MSMLKSSRCDSGLKNVRRQDNIISFNYDFAWDGPTLQVASRIIPATKLFVSLSDALFSDHSAKL